jgi:hypothetical protein
MRGVNSRFGGLGLPHVERMSGRTREKEDRFLVLFFDGTGEDVSGTETLQAQVDFPSPKPAIYMHHAT